MVECPDVNEWTALADGEATENRARSLREHLETCEACRRALSSTEALLAAVGSPSPDPVTEAAVTRLLSAVAHAPPRSRDGHWPWFRGQRGPRLAVLASAAAMLGSIALPRVLRHHGFARSDAPPASFLANGDFAGRAGGGARSAYSEVAITVFRDGQGEARLHEGDDVSPETPYSLAYRNARDPLAPDVFLSVFALDSQGEIHWIVPAYLDAQSDPTSVVVPRASVETLFPMGTELDGPAAGPLSVITLLTPRGIHVSEVEGISPTGRTVGELARHFAPGEIRSVRVNVVGSEKTSRPRVEDDEQKQDQAHVHPSAGDGR